MKTAGQQQPADSGRRSFLAALFTETDQLPGETCLQPVKDLPGVTDSVLWALAGDSPDNLFLAGDDGCILHLDGNAWRREEMGSSLNIHSLALSGERVYAVGWLGLIAVREEGNWRILQGGSTEPGRVNQPLFDIEAAADGELWAVGDNGRVCSSTGGEWIEHIHISSANLRCVLPLREGGVLVSGLGGMVLEYDGKDWCELETGTGCAIVSMAELGDGSVLAVGGEYSLESGSFEGRLFHYSAGSWQQLPLDISLPRLRRVRREGGSLIITADGGAAFRWTPEGVRPLKSGVHFDLHDAISFAPGQALVCGDAGILLQELELRGEALERELEPEAVWEPLAQGLTNHTLRTLWALDEDTVIAAGDGGHALHISESGTLLQPLPRNLRVHQLWGSSVRNVFAACDDATILHFDGSSWSEVYCGQADHALLAITGFGPHDIFAVGDNGYALRYDGLGWKQLETGVQQELYSLWGADSQHLLAVGGGGMVLRFNGSHWKPFTAGTDFDLYSVAGSGLSKLYLCGLNGTLIRFEDKAWHREQAGVRSDLHAITGSGEAWFAVGSGGTVLCKRGGTWQQENSGTGMTLQAVTSAGGRVYAAGACGTVLCRGASAIRLP